MLIRQTGSGWQVPTGRAYSDEASLERLLEETPSLLPGPDDDKPMIVARQVTVGTGAIDLLGISRSGSITVVECKLQANPEIRRSVVGQVFAYASALWGMTPESLDRAFQARAKVSIIEGVRATLRASDPDWNESAFRQALADNLSSGRFRLVLAVDAITPELKRIVEYLNDHTVPDVLVVALELTYFTHDGVEILEPRVYGQEAEPRKTRGQGEAWTEPRFREAVGSRAVEIRLMERVLAWAERQSLRVWFGRGRVEGSIYPILDLGDRWYPTFALWTSGSVQLQLGTLKTRPPFDRKDVRLEFLHRLNSIPGVHLPESRVDAFPSFPGEVLDSETAWSAFEAACDWALDQARSENSGDMSERSENRH